MRKRTHTQPVECTEYFGDDGGQLGAVLNYRHAGRNRYAAEAHDWNTDAEGYDPINIGVFDDPEQAAQEIETRARAAQDPDPHPYPHRGVCRFCGCPLERSSGDDVFVLRTLHGRHEECDKAPLQENGDPGHHVPVKAVSVNGIVPE